ncbi:MAG: DNA replication/repair protein RecF [Chloroflexia bacterium]|nr:DNA replication/repair protein RecF [Chloroflexia bacterium]
MTMPGRTPDRAGPQKSRKFLPRGDAMHLQQLELTNFRNYRHLKVRLPSGTAVLWGGNASGKTSFLEAVYMLATTRSPRAGAERELIHWQAPFELGIPPFARLVAQVQRRDGPLTIEMVVQHRTDRQGELSSRCQKSFQVNGRKVRTQQAAGRLRAVLFQPEDLRLITGSPARRRDYVDAVLVQADPLYWKSLRRYQRVISQRNQLLRRWREQGVPPAAREQIAFWNREMVQKGAYLIVARQGLLDALAPNLEQLHGQLSGASQPFRLRYQHQVECNPREDEEGVAYAFRRALEKAWPRERERGMTLLGPHRDDLGFLVGDVDLAAYGSRGQQRTATIALKLAQVEWLQQTSAEEPVVLLDDVLSELDPERQGYLQRWLLQGGHQVLITTTDLQVFRAPALGAAQVFRVEEGRWQQPSPDPLAAVEPPAPPQRAEE